METFVKHNLFLHLYIPEKSGKFFKFPLNFTKNSHNTNVFLEKKRPRKAVSFAIKVSFAVKLSYLLELRAEVCASAVVCAFLIRAECVPSRGTEDVLIGNVVHADGNAVAEAENYGRRSIFFGGSKLSRIVSPSTMAYTESSV